MKISLKLAQVSDFAQQIKTPISFFCCQLIILFGWAIHHQFVVSVSRLALCLGLYANFWCMLTQVCDRVTSYKQTSLPPLPLLRVFPCRAIKNKRWMMAFVLLIQMFGVTRFSFFLYPGRERGKNLNQNNRMTPSSVPGGSDLKTIDPSKRGEVMSFLDGLTTPLLLDSIVPRAQKIHQTCYLFIYV